MKYPIGFKYTDRHKKECEVVDHLITTTSSGSVWKERYLVKRNIGCQIVMDENVVETSIDMALGMIKQS